MAQLINTDMRNAILWWNDNRVSFNESRRSEYFPESRLIGVESISMWTFYVANVIDVCVF